METIKEMTMEKFQEIYTDEDLRNKVAYAHRHCKNGGEFLYMATCSYPIKWIVTQEQISLANVETEKKKKEIFETHKNDLLFVGMGMTYTDRYPDDVGNYRIRTEFLNKKEDRFFVEFGTGRKEGETRCDYAIDRSTKTEQDEGTYNYMNLERADFLPRYTRQNILDLINSRFDCAFKNIVIDNFNIHPNDREIICISPKE